MPAVDAADRGRLGLDVAGAEIRRPLAAGLVSLGLDAAVSPAAAQAVPAASGLVAAPALEAALSRSHEEAADRVGCSVTAA